MAHKKGQGSTRNGRDSNPQYRGVKRFGGQRVKAGGVIIRQVGKRFYPGENVGLGRDYTIFSLVEGTVRFQTISKQGKKRVSVEPLTEAAAAE